MKKITLVIYDVFEEEQKSTFQLVKDFIYNNFNESINYKLQVEDQKDYK
jgi:hypothetical protein